jgi:hypothetical protein
MLPAVFYWETGDCISILLDLSLSPEKKRRAMIHGKTGRTRHTGQTVKSSMDIVLYSLYSSQSKEERKIGMAKRTRAAGLFVCGVHKNPIRHLAASEPPPSQQFSCFYFLPRFSTQTAFALFRGVVIFVPLVSKMSSKA